MLSEVKLLITEEDEGQEIMGRVRFDGSKISYVGLSKETIEEFELYGIQGKMGKTYMPSDGMSFLNNLQFAFAGGVLRATKAKIIVNV